MKGIIATVLLTILVAIEAKSIQSSPYITPKNYFTYYGNSRIISGEPAKAGQFPWQVGVYIDVGGGTAFCGGSLINPNWVMTAAHCVQGGKRWTIIAGSLISTRDGDSKQVIRESKEAIYHENYNYYLNNDIGLIKLQEAVPLTDLIKAIPISTSNEDLAGKGVTVSGWGKITDGSAWISETLNFVGLTAITNNKCSEVYGPEVIIDSTLCAVGHPEHSTCNGDSGGPLIKYGENGEATQVGIVSFVHILGCSSGNPSGYVRPGKYVNWIAAKTGLSIKEFT